MSDLRRAAEMALEALESYPLPFQTYAKEALRTALAQPDYWQEEARRYAANADYWRSKANQTTLAQPEPNCKSDFDLLFEANSADIEALQDAQFTLEAIKNADPGTHDEIIDASLKLIKVALSKSVFGPIERIAERIGVEI